MKKEQSKIQALKNNPFLDGDSYDLICEKIEEILWEFGMERTIQKENYDKERLAGFSWSLTYGNIVKGYRPVTIKAFEKLAKHLGLKTDTSKVGQIKIMENEG